MEALAGTWLKIKSNEWEKMLSIFCGKIVAHLQSL
jgi:hypothetical protein